MKRVSNLLRRVDIQVSLFTAAIVAVLTLSSFFFLYQMTYQDMLRSLRDQAISIYTFVNQHFDMSSFETISTREDMEDPLYIEMHDIFREVKEITGVRYLYTAKQNGHGEFVYVIDGLDPDSPDFRYPGDLIEPEIYHDMNRALTGTAVFPQRIKDTEWGKIFIAYLPIRDNGQVIGVIGIEFEAEHQFMTYRRLRLMVPFYILFFVLIASLISRLMFRQISNPFYQDMANTDYLTGLKNRNAFQLDMDNLIAKNLQEDMGFLVIDLNRLKVVNDAHGHEAGDRYICCISNAYFKLQTKEAVLYRTGGDEFVLAMPGATEEKLFSFVKRFTEAFQQEAFLPGLSFSWGHAIYDKIDDANLHSTYRRADKLMYARKQEYHQSAS